MEADIVRAAAMKFVAIIVLTVLTCVLYGIIHDQITVRICIEYFTIGHPPVFATRDPTLLALGWGVIATWWVGVLLGVPLACAARLGDRPRREPQSFIQPLLRLSLFCFAVATLAGLAGFVAASNGWVVLVGDLAARVPADRHVAFLVDLWAHVASYAAGFLAGIELVLSVWRKRRRPCQDETANEDSPASAMQG